MSYTGSHRVSITQLQNIVRRLCPAPVSFTLTTTGWTQDSGDTTGYGYHYDLTAVGITAQNTVIAVIAPASQGTAAACGLCLVSETLSGAIRFRAASVPTAAITGTYLKKISAVSA